MTTTRPQVPTAPRRLPGALPLIGHGLAMRREALDFIAGAREHGEVVELRLGPKPAYLVTSPAGVRDLLVNHSQVTANGVLFEKLKILGGDGIGSIYGPPHRRRRRLLTPLFSQQQAAGYGEVAAAVTAEKADSWSDGQQIRLDEHLHEMAAAIVVRSLFPGGGVAAVARAAQDLPVVFKGVAKRAYAPTELLFALPTPDNQRFAAANRRLHGLVDDIIEECRRDPSETGMLAALLAARDEETQEPLTHAQVHDEVMTMFFVGTEASAAAFGWIFHLLDRHPEVASRVHAELDEVVGKRPVGYADVQRLGYLRQVTHEALRMYPPGWLFPRIPQQDLVIAGYRIPAGTNVFYSPYALHRDPASFAEPDRFDPDRWSADRAAAIPRDAYLPFGEGARTCIGGAFALSEAMIVAAGLLSRWRLIGVDGHRVTPVAATTLHPDRLDMVVRAH
ncbi:cytochrome P450 [Streptomyces sp. SID13031]|uniref:cytochrome P450 n=1 Tax=Streptomyces sp. SID13031 TaxID=2706046 RepID=UPI0013CC7A40|nr:cytochrome P450 [Streptomyces sp. SID13031]NEA30614.1 cytochrome P450 [Streptomyces sp. SID13031]